MLNEVNLAKANCGLVLSCSTMTFVFSWSGEVNFKTPFTLSFPALTITFNVFCLPLPSNTNTSSLTLIITGGVITTGR